MIFWDLFRRKAATDSATVRLLEWLNISPTAGDLSEATYFACLKVLSESIGKLPLKLLRTDGRGGVQPAREHPLYHIVGSRPNPYMTATHFWSTIEYNRNHYGNGYAYILGAGSRITLWPLQADRVTVMVDDRGLWGRKNAIWYIYRDPKTGPLRISYDSMLHFRGSASFDGITGIAVRTALAETMEGSRTAQAMLNKSYRNGFVGKMALQYTGALSADLEREYKRRIADYIASDTGDGVLPMMLGTSLQPISAKLADEQFVELKRYSALQIAAAFGIKPNQINDYEKSSYASAEAQQLAFYVDTLLYIIKQYEEELGAKLLSDEEIAAGYGFKFNVSVILRADLKTQIESLVSAVQSGIYTPDEARAILDYPSKGADKLLVNGTMIPVDQAGSQYNTTKE